MYTVPGTIPGAGELMMNKVDASCSVVKGTTLGRPKKATRQEDPKGEHGSDTQELGEEYFRQGTDINAQRTEMAWTVPETVPEKEAVSRRTE